jgi:uncharacterized membrane protein YccC
MNTLDASFLLARASLSVGIIVAIITVLRNHRSRSAWRGAMVLLGAAICLGSAGLAFPTMADGWQIALPAVALGLSLVALHLVYRAVRSGSSTR